MAHRDMKLNNMLLHIEKNGEQVYKIADFGTAKAYDNQREFLSTFCGTELYLHPILMQRVADNKHEQRKRYDANIDLWSVGVTLYELAASAKPFGVDETYDQKLMFRYPYTKDLRRKKL
jgi:serine/threonine protein kinase